MKMSSRVWNIPFGILMALLFLPVATFGQEHTAVLDVSRLELLLDEAGIGVVRNEVHRLLAGPEGSSSLNLSELFAFGGRLRESGRLDEAVAVLQLAVEAFPESARAQMILGDAYAALGDLDRQAAGYGEALAVIDRAELDEYLREHGYDLPGNAQDVIDRHIEAIGGREVLEALETMEIRYSGHSDGGEGTADIVRQYKRPHYIRQYAEGRDYALVTDGRTTWRVGESGWTELEDGGYEHRPDITHDLIDYRSKGIGYTYMGVVAKDGIVFNKLRKTYLDGYGEDYFFAADTDLLTRVESWSVIGPGEMHYWGYSAEGGLLVPRVFIVAPQRFDGIHGGIVKEVKLNPPLADSLFVRP